MVAVADDLLVSGGSRRPLRVLVVEDDPVMRTLVQRRLVDDGHIVVAVESAESALATVATLGCPDVAVVDIGLPGKDGVELADELRTHACPQAPAIVFCSAQRPPDAAPSQPCQSSQSSWQDLFVQKPFHPAELFAAVRQAAYGDTTGDTAHEQPPRACSRINDPSRT